MTFLFVLLAVYILAVNFYGVRLTQAQRDLYEEGDRAFSRFDGKLLVAAALGGAIAIYATMFATKYKLSNFLFMVAIPLLAVLNVYCFILGFRGIYLFT